MTFDWFSFSQSDVLCGDVGGWRGRIKLPGGTECLPSRVFRRKAIEYSIPDTESIITGPGKPLNATFIPPLLQFEHDPMASVVNVFGGSKVVAALVTVGATGMVAGVAGTLGPLVRCIAGDLWTILGAG